MREGVKFHDDDGTVDVVWREDGVTRKVELRRPTIGEYKRLRREIRKVGAAVRNRAKLAMARQSAIRQEANAVYRDMQDKIDQADSLKEREGAEVARANATLELDERLLQVDSEYTEWADEQSEGLIRSIFEVLAEQPPGEEVELPGWLVSDDDIAAKLIEHWKRRPTDPGTDKADPPRDKGQV